MFSSSLGSPRFIHGYFIIKHYITEVEKQNKFSDKRQYVYVKAIKFFMAEYLNK